MDLGLLLKEVTICNDMVENNGGERVWGRGKMEIPVDRIIKKINKRE